MQQRTFSDAIFASALRVNLEMSQSIEKIDYPPYYAIRNVFLRYFSGEEKFMNLKQFNETQNLFLKVPLKICDSQHIQNILFL